MNKYFLNKRKRRKKNIEKENTEFPTNTSNFVNRSTQLFDMRYKFRVFRPFEIFKQHVYPFININIVSMVDSRDFTLDSYYKNTNRKIIVNNKSMM